MNRILIGLVIGLASPLLNAAMQRVAPDGVDAEDADTLQVTVGEVSYRVQLPGVDAPESLPNPKLLRDIERTGLDADTLLALGRAADQGLRALLTGFEPYSLEFDPDRRDKYDRIPGDLHNAAGQPLSLRLVEAGYAIPLHGLEPAPQAALDAAMAVARDERRGLWGSHPDTFILWTQPAAVVPAR